MSPRAAARLEAMAFEEVYDYADGKMDWLAAGLPSEGSATAEPRAVDAARRDVPTCRIDEDLASACARAAVWRTVMVVDEDGILLGRLGRRAVAGDTSGTVEDAMTEGPSTVRPNAPLEKVVERMREHALRSYPVTTSDGRLFGLVLREEAEKLLERRRRD